MRKIKKTAAVLLVACALAVGLFPEQVRADVVIELEYKDDFLKKHESECEEVRKSFLVNSPAGKLTVYSSPESAKKKTEYENGTILQGIWRYEDKGGEEWYALKSPEAHGETIEISGWIRTAECFPIPDNNAFLQKYSEEFVSMDPAYEDALKEVSTVTFWSYPCSGVIAAEEVQVGDLAETGGINAYCGKFWKDPEGRVWGYINYFRGIRNVWLCLSAPSATDIEADDRVLSLAPEVIYPAGKDGITEDQKTGKDGEDNDDGEDNVEGESNEDGSSPGNNITLVTIGAVFAVTAVTIVLLMVFFGGSRKKNNNKEASDEEK